MRKGTSAESRPTSDDDTTRLWLVEQSYDDRDLVILIYATPDGEYRLRKELTAVVMHQRRMAVAAAIDASTESLEPADDDDLCERYVVEATRMADPRGPDDEV